MSAPKPTLPTDSAARKEVPLARGVLDYFPAALAAVARLSKAGNDKHNPGQEMHHARGKSTDHADCIMRHLADRGTVDPEDGIRHAVKVAWRALALLQEELEAAGEAPLARGARLPERKVVTAAEGDALAEAARRASEIQWEKIGNRTHYRIGTDAVQFDRSGAYIVVDGFRRAVPDPRPQPPAVPPFEKAFETLQAERKRISTPPAERRPRCQGSRGAGEYEALCNNCDDPTCGG